MLGNVFCADHGEAAPAVVCKHLVHGSGLGFIEGMGEQEPDATEELAAWCNACETVRQQHGGWNEASEAVASITLICENCFVLSRTRNELHGLF